MKKTSGFTLIELIIVVAIIAILLAISFSVPKDRLAVGQAAQGLSRDLQATRFEAISRNWFVGLHLDTSNNTYIIYCDNPAVDPGNTSRITDCRSDKFDPNPALSNKQYDTSDIILKRVNVATDFATRVTIPAPKTAYSATIFDPRGILATAAAKTITLGNSSGSYTKSIALTQQGRVKIQ